MIEPGLGRPRAHLGNRAPDLHRKGRDPHCLFRMSWSRYFPPIRMAIAARRGSIPG
jgi:hypothetical protein